MAYCAEIYTGDSAIKLMTFIKSVYAQRWQVWILPLVVTALKQNICRGVSLREKDDRAPFWDMPNIRNDLDTYVFPITELGRHLFCSIFKIS